MSVILVLSSLFLFTIAFAQETYRTRISAGYLYFDDELDYELNDYGISASVFFSPVDPKDHLRAEASFLERIGGVSVFGSLSDFETGNGYEGDGFFYGVSTTLMKPKLPFMLAAKYAKQEDEYDKPIDSERSIDYLGLSMGYFVSDTLLLDVSFTRSKEDREMKIVLIDNYSFVLNSTIEYDAYGISAKYVNEKSGHGGFNIEGGVKIIEKEKGVSIDNYDYRYRYDDGTNLIFGAHGDYYFNQDISIGGTAQINTGDNKDDEGAILGANAMYFITPRISMGCSYTKFFADNDEGKDEDVIKAMASIRF